MDLKVVVKINKETTPELAALIEAVPARSRAERLRTLATLGAAIFTGKAVPGGRGISYPPPFTPPVSEASPESSLSPLKGLKGKF